MVCQEPASLGLELPICLYLCPRASAISMRRTCPVVSGKD